MNAVNLIIAREYLERVKRKSFIITTILTPLLMIVLMAMPTLIILFSTPEQRHIAVVDDSGVIAPYLRNTDEIVFVNTDEPLKILRNDNDYDGILVLESGIVDKKAPAATLYSRGASSIMTEEHISRQISDAIENQRIKAYDIENLRQILDEVQTNVSLSTIRIDKDEDAETSSMVSYIMGLAMDMMLYMFILIYGQMVMTSIIEEKNNRVLEIVVSSVNPTSLMLGKIVGIGLVAITQIVIWGGLLALASAWGLPVLGSMVEKADDPELVGVMSQLGDPMWLASLFGWLVLFFIGGYLFYSAIWAAIGSSVDNIQDASQLSSVATVPVIIGIICSMSIVQDPESTLAVWVSMIPFTSPMAMMSRLPFGIPVWQIITSLIILYASFLALIWIAAKIYRVGIFMYGKKPTVADLIRWARYK
ncbi:MAG: ABC transporter permease [Muribaculaceae bacterium]|nr:ABC transporter permease [Muribaculaceae bacterium]